VPPPCFDGIPIGSFFADFQIYETPTKPLLRRLPGSPAAPTSPSALERDRQPTSGDTQYGDHHSYLLKMRMEGGLEGIEIGPLLGRGSYGKVYKVRAGRQQ